MSRSQHVFSLIPRADIPRSSFNRTHGYKTTFDAGKLIPFYLDEVLPGDTFNCKATIFARLSTLLTPVMDNIVDKNCRISDKFGLPLMYQSTRSIKIYKAAQKIRKIAYQTMYFIAADGAVAGILESSSENQSFTFSIICRHFLRFLYRHFHNSRTEGFYRPVSSERRIDLEHVVNIVSCLY